MCNHEMSWADQGKQQMFWRHVKTKDQVLEGVSFLGKDKDIQKELLPISYVLVHFLDETNWCRNRRRI